MDNDLIKINYLKNESNDPAQVVPGLGNSGEDISSSFDHPCVEHVEEGHHGKGVEDHRVVDGSRVENVGRLAVADAEEFVAWKTTKNCHSDCCTKCTVDICFMNSSKIGFPMFIR